MISRHVLCSQRGFCGEGVGKQSPSFRVEPNRIIILYAKFALKYQVNTKNLKFCEGIAYM